MALKTASGILRSTSENKRFVCCGARQLQAILVPVKRAGEFFNHTVRVREHSLLEQIPFEVLGLAAVLPRLADGRIDYSTAAEAPVLDCYVVCQEQILILKRRRPLLGTGTAWHVVSGFLDEECSLRTKVEAELFEETGIQEVVRMHALTPYRHEHERVWIVYPVMVEVNACGAIRLNEEHSKYAWVPVPEMNHYLLPHVYAAFRQ
jgi:8-oxo-dGTP pyrophosphatase MutT (NUDIX family)